MRIVTRQQLMELPPGTLYHDWQPCNFGDLCIKGESIMHEHLGRLNDWYECHVPSLDVQSSEEDCDIQFRMADNPDLSCRVDLEIESREGLFDDKMRYAVWERADVIALRDRLNRSLGL